MSTFKEDAARYQSEWETKAAQSANITPDAFRAIVKCLSDQEPPEVIAESHGVTVEVVNAILKAEVDRLIAYAKKLGEMYPSRSNPHIPRFH